MADHPSESDTIAAWRSIALKYQQLQRLLSAQRAPYSAHVRGGRPYSGPECTQQGAAPIVDPWPVLVHPQVHLTCAHLLHSAPKGRPGNIRDCTHHCTKCPHAPPFSVLLAPSSNQSCHNREQGAFRARRWCRYRCRWERAYRLPITCLTPAQAAPTIETQRLSRVFAWALGGRLVHIYRAWASVGKQAVLRVGFSHGLMTMRCKPVPARSPPSPPPKNSHNKVGTYFLYVAIVLNFVSCSAFCLLNIRQNCFGRNPRAAPGG